MADTSKRALTTAEGKRMYLEPDVMGFDIKSSGHAMSLEDAKNITFRSGNNVNIWAAEGIELSAKRVTIHTPKELNIVRDPEH